MITSIKRTFSSLKADIAFQTKQGFLAVYVVVAAIYIIILSQLPQSILQYAVPIVVFTDPSVLGLIFIGGILMLEKEQGVTQFLAVTPLKFSEYIISKVLSLAAISLVAGLIISISSYHGAANYLLVCTSIMLVSIFFSLLGYIISQKCTSVNSFIMKSVPFIALFIIPCFSIIGFKGSELFLAVPTVAAFRLMIGAYTGIKTLFALALVLYVALWDAFMIFLAKKSYEKTFM